MDKPSRPRHPCFFFSLRFAVLIVDVYVLLLRGVQVLVNVAVALAAMGVGALGLSLDLSSLLGGLMVLLFALFGRFLLNGSRTPGGAHASFLRRCLDGGGEGGYS